MRLGPLTRIGRNVPLIRVNCVHPEVCDRGMLLFVSMGSRDVGLGLRARVQGIHKKTGRLDQGHRRNSGGSVRQSS